MKLKFYMRGLGIGILVTAVLMSVTINGKTEKLTDKEIIERAKALGMEEKYDSTVLSAGAQDVIDGSNVPEIAETPEIPDVSEMSDAPEIPETSDTPETPEIADPSENSDGVSQNEIEKSERESVLTVQVTVQGGDGSMSVSRKLQEAGLIENVLDYDKFLCQNGYDRKICTGTHSIPVDATEEEIARILTTRVN